MHQLQLVWKTCEEEIRKNWDYSENRTNQLEY